MEDEEVEETTEGRRGGSPERSQASVLARRLLNYSWRLALQHSLRGIQTKKRSFFCTRAETANSPAELRVFTPTKLDFACFLTDMREGAEPADLFYCISSVYFLIFSLKKKQIPI